MKKEGKIKSLNRWKEREARGMKTTLEVLSKSIQVMPMENGTIQVQLGAPNGMGINFIIPAQHILDAAEAGIKFVEDLKKNDNMGATEFNERINEAGTLPARSE